MLEVYSAPSVKDEIIGATSVMLAAPGMADVVDKEVDSIGVRAIEKYGVTIFDIQLAIQFTQVDALGIEDQMAQLGDDPLRHIERAVSVLDCIASVGMPDVSDDALDAMFDEAFEDALQAGYLPIESLAGENLLLALIAKELNLSPVTVFAMAVQLAVILAALDIDDDDENFKFYIRSMATFYLASLDVGDVDDEDFGECFVARLKTLQERFCAQCVTGARSRRVMDLMRTSWTFVE